MTEISISKYRGDNSTSFTGRKEGELARNESGLSKLDKDSNNYKIIVPKGTTAFNPSFYLGFFFESIKSLGIKKFEEKYIVEILDTDEGLITMIKLDIEEGKRHANNQLKKRGGLMRFLNIL